MAQFGKSSSKRSKASYVYSIIGVSLILFLLGVMGWIFLNFRQVGNSFKEDIRISAYLRTMNKDTINQIQQFIASKPFAKRVEYIDKEKAKSLWNKDGNEDWDKILDYNPLPESIDFYANAAYLDKDSLQKINGQLMGAYPDQISDITYPQTLVNTVNEKTKTFGIAFLVVSVILGIIVIVIIDNTIRLAMFSNRFLIKTMQMVGATRQFITRPMDIRAVVNGLISSGIAIVLLFLLIQWAERWIPQLKAIHDMQLNLMLFGGMLVIGVGISLISTHRSVVKYLKLKLDDLY
jgi:cell division transport system permease protein